MNAEQINLVTVDRFALRNSLIPNYFLNPTLCVGPLSPRDFPVGSPTSSTQDRISAYEYTSSVFERVFPDVCDGLNRFHDVTRSNRYWRIICGLWLSYFIDICFERFSSINRASLDPMFTNTRIVSQDAAELCSGGCTGFIDLYQSDRWNHYVYGLIIKHFKLAQVDIVSDDSIFEVPVQLIQEPEQRSSKERILRFTNRFVGKSKYALASTYLPRKYEWMINLKHAQIPLHWPLIIQKWKPFSFQQRQKLELKLESTDEFETFIRAILHLHMPKTIVEEYRELLLAVQGASLPKSPSVIFTSNLHASSDSFAVWSALQVERGARFLIGQHGGLYGEGLLPTRHEWHEIIVSDQYVTWGWDDPLQTKVLPGFSFVNAGVKERHTSEDADRLLLVTDSQFPYSRLSWSTLEINSRYVRYVADLLSAVDSNIRNHLLLRMHHDWNRFPNYDYGTWLSKIEATQVNYGLSPIQRLYERSRVVVCTTLGGTYRETFARNIPTILLIDEDVYPIRQSSQIDYQKLADCQILHYSPESAGNFLSQIFSDPTSWWFSESVQSARREFLDRHARIPTKAVSEVERMLKFERSADIS